MGEGGGEVPMKYIINIDILNLRSKDIHILFSASDVLPLTYSDLDIDRV